MDEYTYRNSFIAEVVEVENTFKLKGETGLKIKMGRSSNVRIQLLSGCAEIYGTLMDLGKEYSLSSNTSFGIYTWNGCKVKVIGTPETMQIEKESSLMISVHLHVCLAERRQLAVTHNKKGPVLLVVGGNYLIKNNVCKSLVNYAVRMEQSPVFLDLDLHMNSLSFPGTVGMLTVKRPADVVTGFYDHPTQIHQFGYGEPIRSKTGYYLLMKKLSEVLESDILQQNSNVQTSGVIIKGCAWNDYEIQQFGFNALSLIISNFNIDLICVLHQEELYVQLEKEYGSMMQLLFFPKRDTDDKYFSDEATYAFRFYMNKYLYGPINQQKHFIFEVKYSDIQVFKIVSKWNPRRLQSLPYITESHIEFVPVQLSEELIDEFIAITNSDTIKENPMYKPVLGFFGITALDVKKDSITVISPQPGPLPKKVLLMGEIKLKTP